MQANTHYALFMIAGMPFRLPISWITYEERHVQNLVQASEQADQLPAVCMSQNQLIIELEIPQVLQPQSPSIALLKSYLLKHTQLWSTLKYHSSTALGQGLQHIPFTGITLASAMPYITGYLGAQHYLLGGMVSHFSSRYHPKTLLEIWRIHLDALNLSLLRQSSPLLLHQGLTHTMIGEHYSKYSIISSDIDRSHA